MKQAPLIGSVTALSLLLLGLIMSHQSTANSPPLLENRYAYRLAEPNNTPLLNPFQSLTVAAKSLPYLSRMKYAIAAINPEILIETETVKNEEGKKRINDFPTKGGLKISFNIKLPVMH